MSAQPAADRAFSWLMSKRLENWGWDTNTAEAIIAIQLTNQSWLSKDNPESLLSVKQLELDTALTLWR